MSGSALRIVENLPSDEWEECSEFSNTFSSDSVISDLSKFWETVVLMCSQCNGESGDCLCEKPPSQEVKEIHATKFYEAKKLSNANSSMLIF